MKTRTIRQWTWIPASPKAVYEALMTTKGHRGFTGASARISPKVGGRFMAWDGYIHGSNVELVPGRRIVQLWRPTEEDWPDAHETRVIFTLAAARGGTRISFTQSGVPSQHVGHLSDGWREHYWNRLKEYFG